MDTSSSKSETALKPARNEPCPCGSGKKYKRCCGVDAEPQFTTVSQKPSENALSGNPFFDPSKMDPQMMSQISEAMQKLPKGQLQRLQSLVQKAMSGKDVSREADEFEKALPPGVREMLMSAKNTIELTEKASSITQSDQPMTEEQARAIVAAAAEKGEIPADQAEQLLGENQEPKPKGFGKLWKSFKGKK